MSRYSYLLWWQVDPAQVDAQVAEYDTLGITKSARGQSMLCCALTVGVTSVLGPLLGLTLADILPDAIVWTILGLFMYRGNKWAFAAGMLVWTIEKGMAIVGRLGEGRLPWGQFLFWALYMHTFFLGFKVADARGDSAPKPSSKSPGKGAAARGVPSTSTDGQVFVTKSGTSTGPKDFVTPLAPDFTQKHGLPAHAAIGEVTRRLAAGEQITPASFAANPAFVDFLHQFLENHSASDPKVKAEAYQIIDGTLNIVDQRKKHPAGKAPPEDIIATIEVSNGALTVGSYKRGDQHLLLSDAGFFKLGTKRHADFLTSLRESVEAPA